MGKKITPSTEKSAEGVCKDYLFGIFSFIIIEGHVLKCYPKYLLDATAPKAELKQVLKVLEK